MGNNANLLIFNTFSYRRKKMSDPDLDEGNLAGILLLHRLTDARVSSAHWFQEVSR